MNKRQKKKNVKKKFEFSMYEAFSYQDYKFLKRSYHEYEVSLKHKEKSCKTCKYFIEGKHAPNGCAMIFMCLPCIRDI